jgi:hypothetical protein
MGVDAPTSDAAITDAFDSEAALWTAGWQD